MANKPTGETVPLHKRAVIRTMHDRGYSNRAIARELGISGHTVKAVLESEVDAIEQAAAARIKEALPAALRMGAAKLVDHIVNPDVIAKASLRDATVSMGILIDKARLEAGESTGGVELILNIQAQADKDYIEGLKAQALPTTAPTQQLPAPVEAETVEPIPVQPCPAKVREYGAPRKNKKKAAGKPRQQRAKTRA